MNVAVETAVIAALPDRRKFLGGSDIPALLGIAPETWRRNSPVSLFYDKIEPPKEEAPLPAYDVRRRGKRWESVVAEMLVEELHTRGHKVEIIGGNRRFTDEECAFFAAEIDFEVRLDGEEDITNVEIKTVHPFKAREWGESETDDAPDYVIAQAAWGLGVAPGHRKRCIIAPLFGADWMKVFPIERDEELIGGIRARGFKFWTQHVLKRVPPSPLFLSDMGLLYPTSIEQPALEADEPLIEKVLQLRAVSRELGARQAEYDVLELQIKRAMGSFPELTLAGKKAITWKERPWAALQQTALKEAYPQIHKQFMKKGVSRVFSLCNFEWNGEE